MDDADDLLFLIHHPLLLHCHERRVTKSYSLSSAGIVSLNSDNLFFLLFYKKDIWVSEKKIRFCILWDSSRYERRFQPERSFSSPPRWNLFVETLLALLGFFRLDTWFFIFLLLYSTRIYNVDVFSLWSRFQCSDLFKTNALHFVFHFFTVLARTRIHTFGYVYCMTQMIHHRVKRMHEGVQSRLTVGLFSAARRKGRRKNKEQATRKERVFLFFSSFHPFFLSLSHTHTHLSLLNLTSFHSFQPFSETYIDKLSLVFCHPRFHIQTSVCIHINKYVGMRSFYSKWFQKIMNKMWRKCLFLRFEDKNGWRWNKKWKYRAKSISDGSWEIWGFFEHEKWTRYV